jgi:thiol-disulfide isomerase/thioredoxin
MPRVRPPFLAALLVPLVLLAGCTGSSLEPVAPVALDEPLPLLEGDTLDGGRFSSAGSSGSPLVVNAWASWCEPCEEETPQLVALSREFADEGVRFLGINHADQHAAATAFAERVGIPYQSIEDPAGRLAAQLGYVGLPATFVVDAGGTVRWALFGPTDAATLRPLIEDVVSRGGETG